MFYIHCGRDDWDREAFFATGKTEVAEWMRWIGDTVERERLIEIGCGLGRLSVALAREFEHVDALDISASMIEQARGLSPPPNVQYHEISGDGALGGFASSSYDFATSKAVFQHVPDEEALATYLREIGRVLKPGGGGLLHFNTTPPQFLRTVVYLLPDTMLPRTSRRYMRCYRRDAGRVHDLIGAAGLVIEWERAPRSSQHHLLVRKPKADFV